MILFPWYFTEWNAHRGGQQSWGMFSVPQHVVSLSWHVTATTHWAVQPKEPQAFLDLTAQ